MEMTLQQNTKNLKKWNETMRAVIETDGKKVVALSTLSQLGVIICGYAINNPSIVFFHLLVHAFFKALLFIATGVIIHNSGDSQDLRNIGGIYNTLPITQAVAIFTKARLIGLPFFAAFYSKEIVLEPYPYEAITVEIAYIAMIIHFGDHSSMK